MPRLLVVVFLVCFVHDVTDYESLGHLFWSGADADAEAVVQALGSGSISMPRGCAARSVGILLPFLLCETCLHPTTRLAR
jgi:hypothetical protein